MLLIEKYKPKYEELEKREPAVKELKNLILKEKGGILVYGPVGCGKTAAVHAIAERYNLEILEVNASDTRNKKMVESIIGSSNAQMSLFGKKKVILVDEVDNIAGREDYGGIQALAKIIDNSNFPIVLTANNITDKKMSVLRKKCKLIEFGKVSYDSIFMILKEICKREGIKCEDEILKMISRISGNDVRAAINDLEVLSASKKEITNKDLECLGFRETRTKVEEALNLIFKSKKPEIVLGALDYVDINYEEFILWLEENLPKVYEKEDLNKAFDMLSKADVFFGRIKRWQHWRFLVYINAFLTAGVALAKEKKGRGELSFARPLRPLRIWQSNIKNAKKLVLAEKIAEKLHCSSKKIFDTTIPYLKFIVKKEKERFFKEFGLEKEDLIF